MKKFLLIFLFTFSLLFLSHPLATHAADECWYPSGTSCAQGTCDQKNIDNWTKNNQGVYRSKADCSSKTNQINTLPTATPTPIPPTIDPLAPTPDANAVENVSYTLSPPFEHIDDATDIVTITFKNLEKPVDGDTNFYVCLETDLCIDNDKIRDGLADGNEDYIARSKRMSLDDVDEGTLQRYKLDANNQIVVCGDGSSQLKGSEEKYYQGKSSDGKSGNWWSKIGDNKRGCKPDRDYFHPGKPYLASVYTRSKDGEKDIWVLQSVAGFYTNHHFPETLDVLPRTDLQPGTQFTIDIGTTKANIKANGLNKDTTNRNNYQILIEGSGINTRRCGFLSVDEPIKKFTLPSGKQLLSGKVKITISEQIDELKNISDYIAAGLDFKDDVFKLTASFPPVLAQNPDLDKIVCKGGFVYRIYECNVSKDSTNNSCKQFRNPDAPGTTLPWLDDPNKADIKGLMKYFDKLGVNSANTNLPCQAGGIPVSDPSLCDSMDTALGKIPVDPIGFISKLFSIVLSFAGTGALLTIIYSGYRLLISRGDKEMIQKARERLTSAIVGLLFIVFALALLSIIAVDILKIPGFG